MRYTLWSRGRLVGHTDLDIDTVSPQMRQGFVEPTEEGRPLLRDATGVIRVLTEERSHRHANGGKRSDDHLDRFMAACGRREALHLELRDEENQVFECEFIRVYDLRDMESPAWHRHESDDADYEESLAQLTPEERAEHEEAMAADEAMIDEWVEDLREDQESSAMFHSSWPPPPEPDERWDTMQYHLQVFLKGSFEREQEF